MKKIGCLIGCLIGAIFLVLLIYAATQCNATGKAMLISGQSVYVESYGLFNEDVYKNKNVVYEVSAESVIFSIIFSETIIVPVYFVGYDLYQPVKVKDELK